MIIFYLLTPILLLWVILIIIGKQFALRDTLHNVDAVVCLAGTRGNIEVLHERIDTAVDLYNKGFASTIIMSSKFSRKVRDEFKQISRSEIQQYADKGRINKNDVEFAFQNWDQGLGADYMKEYAVKKGVPEEHIIAENISLHTLENAKYTLAILKEHSFRSIILVTSPFHQKRAFETFSKVMKPEGVSILNYAAISKQWNGLTWFLSWSNVELAMSEIKRIFRYRKQSL